jgi:hypothetical protein
MTSTAGQSKGKKSSATLKALSSLARAFRAGDLLFLQTCGTPGKQQIPRSAVKLLETQAEVAAERGMTVLRVPSAQDDSIKGIECNRMTVLKISSATKSARKN